MNVRVQIIEKDGKPEFAVIPFAEFQHLLQIAQDSEDIISAEKALEELRSGDDEVIPADIVEALVLGHSHPLRIWREYRGFTQDKLAQTANIGKSYISQIEAGQKPGSVKVLSRLATALDIDVDDLIQIDTH